MNFFENVKELIGRNEIEVATEQLRNFSKNQVTDLYNEVILHQAKINRLKKEERTGTISRDDANRERARIGIALLELVDEFSERIKTPLPLSRPPIDFEIPDESNLEKIIGVNNLKDISWLEKGLNIAKSVCRVVTPTGLGSGFMIKNGFLITNNHVIEDPEIAKKTHVEFNYQEDLHGKLLPSYKYKLDHSSFKTNQKLDYSIVKVVDDPAMKPLATWQFLEFETDKNPGINEHVTIIQHPDGGPKQIALTANQIANIYEYCLQYTTDTLPGSSGSPVLNDDWKVIAIHHAGGNLKINKLGQRRFLNEGILISTILDEIKEEI